MAKHAELSSEIMQYVHPLLHGHTVFYKYCKAKIHKAINLVCINLNGENYG
jgi:hypothetical protein